MTRKDYVEIARILNNLKQEIEPQTKESKAFDIAVFDLVEFFLSDNPRFDGEKFERAVYKANA